MSDPTASAMDYCVLAVDFGGTKTDIAVATADGQILRRERTAIDHSKTAEANVEYAFARARSLMGWAEAEYGTPCLAAAIASPGVVREDRIDLAPNVAGWSQLRLPDAARESLGLESITIGNDVNFATIAEHRAGALHGISSGVYLGLGTGVGAGIIINGAIVEGTNGIAGEFGYLPWGEAGTFEEIIGGRAIETRATQAGRATLPASDILAVKSGLLSHVAGQALDAIAAAIETFALILDPERIVLGGGVTEAPDLIRDLQQRLTHLPYRADLQPGRFVHDAVVRGLAIAAGELASTKEPAWKS
jgi:glucokinase